MMKRRYWKLTQNAFLFMLVFCGLSVALIKAEFLQGAVSLYPTLIPDQQEPMPIHPMANLDSITTEINYLSASNFSVTAALSTQHHQVIPAKLAYLRDTEQKWATTANSGWLRPLPQMSRVQYAAQCAAEMGTIPTFSCVEDGVIIPITVNGAPQSQHVAQCDNPVQLGLGRGQGQCVPGARTGNLSAGNPSVTTVFICRKYQDIPDPMFHDIAVIQHNRMTGNTCWFQARLDAEHDGASVPSPMENSITANEFWLEPSGVSGINCQRCHDADPFIWTPYIGQVVGQSPVTWDPKGAYVSNTFGIFGNQPQARVFTPDGNQCVTCHRIGEYTANGANGAVNLVHRAIAAPADMNDLDRNPWMPPAGTVITDDIQQLERCGQDPSRAECNAHLPTTQAVNCTGSLYVDGTYTGPERGSTSHPFRTIGAADTYACHGAKLRIKAGIYPESLTIKKKITLLADEGPAIIGQ